MTSRNRVHGRESAVAAIRSSSRRAAPTTEPRRQPAGGFGHRRRTRSSQLAARWRGGSARTAEQQLQEPADRAWPRDWSGCRVSSCRVTAGNGRREKQHAVPKVGMALDAACAARFALHKLAKAFETALIAFGVQKRNLTACRKCFARHTAHAIATCARGSSKPVGHSTMASAVATRRAARD